jgi:hypothetical protein
MNETEEKFIERFFPTKFKKLKEYRRDLSNNLYREIEEIILKMQYINQLGKKSYRIFPRQDNNEYNLEKYKKLVETYNLPKKYAKKKVLEQTEVYLVNSEYLIVKIYNNRYVDEKTFIIHLWQQRTYLFNNDYDFDEYHLMLSDIKKIITEDFNIIEKEILTKYENELEKIKKDIDLIEKVEK